MPNSATELKITKQSTSTFAQNGEGPVAAQQAAVVFFHTSPVHIDTFNRLRDRLAPGLEISHVVREDLLVAAQKVGGINEAIEFRVTDELLRLSRSGARLVVCTCSSLGGVVEAFDAPGMRTMRIDRPMADEAVATGGPVALVAAFEPTIAVTRDLILNSAEAAGVTLDVATYLIPDCWDTFLRGNVDAYYEQIATYLSELKATSGVIVLAQASMVPAASLAEGIAVPILSSVESGFQAAIDLLQHLDVPPGHSSCSS